MIRDARGEEQRIIFKEDIPAALCKKSASRELTAPFINQIIDDREKDVLATGDYQCLYCGRKSLCLYSTPMLALHDDPPTVLNLAQALCTKNGNTPCARKARMKIEEGLHDPNGPTVSVVYT